MSGYCKVLIADDEFIMRQGMKHMIEWEREGFQIVGEVANGQEALAFIEKVRPHIVLADIVMPVLDGIEFSEIMGKKYPDILLIMLSSYDKFEYVKTTLLNGASDYILKPTLSPEHLLKVLKKAVAKIPGLVLTGQQEMPFQSQIEKVLVGYQDKLNTTVFASRFPYTFYRLFAVSLRQMRRTGREETAEIRQMIEEYFEETLEYEALPVYLEEGVVCVVLNYRRKDEEGVFSSGERLADRMQRIYPKVFWVMSRCFSQIQEIKDYYQHDIMSKLHSGFYHPGRVFLIVEDIQEQVKPERFAFDQYTGYLGKGWYLEALSMFQKYIDDLCRQQVEEDKVKNLTKNLLYNYLMEIEKFSVDSEDLKERYFKQIDQAVCVDDYQLICQEMFDLLRKQPLQGGEAEDYRIREIKEYVEQHYQEQFELSDLARQFNFGYTYLSTYFSQTVKEGFSEYLNRVRIGHACELLRTSNIPIASIGNQVGYGDHSYFCRVFKKVTNETPSNYRRGRYGRYR